MIDWLARKTIKNYKDLENAEVQRKYIGLSGKLGIICNLFLCNLKITTGLAISSVAIISDGVNNLTDMLSSGIAMISSKLSSVPADEEHPYGHGRYEYIASLIVSFIIFYAALELGKKAIGKIIAKESIVISGFAVILLFISVVVKFWMYSYNHKIDRKIDSILIRGIARDSVNDALITSGIIVSLLIERFLKIPVDGYLSLFLSVLIAYNGYSLMKDTVDYLLGKQISQELLNQIDKIIKKGKYIRGYHDLQLHDYGRGKIIGSVHVEIPKNIMAENIHESIDEVEQKILKKTSVCISIHMDPTYLIEDMKNENGVL